MKTHTKETTWLQDSALPNHQHQPVQDASSTQQQQQNYKLNLQQTGWTPHSALLIRGKINKSSAPYMKLTQTTGPASAAAAKSVLSCSTLCDPIDGSPPGSHVPGILQARTLEWVAISFSNVWKWKVKVKSLSRVQLIATPCTAAYQAPLSVGFSRQEYWSGVPLSSPGPASRRAETKRKKRIQPWSLGKGDLKHNKLKNNKKAEKHYTIEGTS